MDPVPVQRAGPGSPPRGWADTCAGLGTDCVSCFWRGRKPGRRGTEASAFSGNLILRNVWARQRPQPESGALPPTALRGSPSGHFPCKPRPYRPKGPKRRLRILTSPTSPLRGLECLAPPHPCGCLLNSFFFGAFRFIKVIFGFWVFN